MRLFPTTTKENSFNREGSVITNENPAVETISELETSEQSTTNSSEQCSFLVKNIEFSGDENSNQQIEFEHFRNECAAEMETYVTSFCLMMVLK